MCNYVQECKAFKAMSEAQNGANSAVGTIGRQIVQSEKGAIPSFYKCIVRPQLE